MDSKHCKKIGAIFSLNIIRWSTTKYFLDIRQTKINLIHLMHPIKPNLT